MNTSTSHVATLQLKIKTVSDCVFHALQLTLASKGTPSALDRVFFVQMVAPGA